MFCNRKKGSGFRVQDRGGGFAANIWGDARRSLDDRLAHGACRPLIGNDRGGSGSEGSMGSTGVVRRISSS